VDKTLRDKAPREKNVTGSNAIPWRIIPEIMRHFALFQNAGDLNASGVEK